MHLLASWVAKAFALMGGLVLSGLIVMTCVSIAGRATGIGAIPGDFELVEAGMAFAIFAFLPLCQITGGHASVDIFTSLLPPRAERVLRAVIEVVLAAVIVLIAWQLFEGMESKRRTGQTTFMLQFPVWWAYAASVVAAAAAALVAVHVAVARVREAVTGRPVLPRDEGAAH